jgi:metal-responsive CopG/Arc/MetJ family transcriptional regulator
MTMLSIILPDPLAKASKEAAKRLGISRTQFIRQAIAHELDHFRLQLEQKAMAESMTAMKKSKTYLKESEEIIQGMKTNIPKDKDEWWKKS